MTGLALTGEKQNSMNMPAEACYEKQLLENNAVWKSPKAE